MTWIYSPRSDGYMTGWHSHSQGYKECPGAAVTHSLQLPQYPQLEAGTSPARNGRRLTWSSHNAKHNGADEEALIQNSFSASPWTVVPNSVNVHSISSGTDEGPMSR